MIILTCEHAVNRVPYEYASLFHGSGQLLDSHSAWDPGASELARELASALKAPLYEGTITRLLIDLNRSLDSKKGAFSPKSRRLPGEDKERLIRDYYLPYRRKIEELLKDAVKRGEMVLHLSIHSFTPFMKGKERRCDIGILYDRARSAERAFSVGLKEEMLSEESDLTVRLNYPYHGKTDGHTSYMRRLFPGEVYIGIELEVSQAVFYKGGESWERLKGAISRSIPACKERFF